MLVWVKAWGIVMRFATAFLCFVSEALHALAK
jgi:hypothetical protein